MKVYAEAGQMSILVIKINKIYPDKGDKSRGQLIPILIVEMGAICARMEVQRIRRDQRGGGVATASEG
jgi:hypothetical protein